LEGAFQERSPEIPSCKRDRTTTSCTPTPAIRRW